MYRYTYAISSAWEDEIIDAVLARGIHADACRRFPLVGWVVMNKPPKLIARLLTGTPSPYVLEADTLLALRGMLPPLLERSDPQPADPTEVIEIWFSR
jgi:hypothetical protein